MNVKVKKLLTLVSVLICSSVMWGKVVYTPVDTIDTKKYLSYFRLYEDNLSFYDSYGKGRPQSRMYYVKVFERTAQSSIVAEISVVGEKQEILQYAYGDESGFFKPVASWNCNQTNSGGVVTLSKPNSFSALPSGMYHIVVFPYVNAIENLSYYSTDDDKGFGHICCFDVDVKDSKVVMNFAGQAVYEGCDSPNLVAFGNGGSAYYVGETKQLFLENVDNNVWEQTVVLYDNVEVVLVGENKLRSIVDDGTSLLDTLTIKSDGKGSLTSMVNCSAVLRVVSANLNIGDDKISYSMRVKQLILNRCHITDEERIWSVGNSRMEDLKGNRVEAVSIQSDDPTCIVRFYGNSKRLDESTLICEQKVSCSESFGLEEIASSLSDFESEEHFMGWTVQGQPGLVYNSAKDILGMRIYEDVAFLPLYQPLSADRGISVSPEKKVLFSPGNLRYDATKQIYYFAENQYSVLLDKSYDENGLSNVTDLFGWGTGDRPMFVGVSPADYVEFKDWGDQPIVNGGNDKWYTLSADEWNYLLHERPNALSLVSTGSVNGVHGIIVLPDVWVKPTSCEFLSIDKVAQWNALMKWFIFDDSNVYAQNQYTSDQWLDMEENGAVFLPMGWALLSFDMHYFAFRDQGSYWSSTLSNNSIYCVESDKYGLGVDANKQSVAMAVRLVKNVSEEDDGTDNGEILAGKNDISVYVDGLDICVERVASVLVFDIEGRIVGATEGIVDGLQKVSVPEAGVYIVVADGIKRTVIVK